jgi:hypothetical protein
MSSRASRLDVGRIQWIRAHRFRAATAAADSCRQVVDSAHEVLRRREMEIQRNQAATDALQAWLDAPRPDDLGGAPLVRFDALMDERRAALQAREDERRALADAEEALDRARVEVRRAYARLAAVDAWQERLVRTDRQRRERRLQREQEDLISTRSPS